MRGLADLRSPFHLQMQFLMPEVKVTTFSEIHLKLAELVILSPIWGPEWGQESLTGSDVPCFDGRRRLIDPFWMLVHGYSCVNHYKMSSLWDFRWVYRYVIFLYPPTQNILFFASICEYLLFYPSFFFFYFWHQPAPELPLNRKQLGWKSSRKPGGQNRPHFSPSLSGFDIFGALLSSLLS